MMMNVEQIAEFIGVSRSTIYGLVKTNEIPHIRIKSRVLFDKEEIKNWVRIRGNDRCQKVVIS